MDGFLGGLPSLDGGAPKERRGRRAEKWLSKRVFLESPFIKGNLKGVDKKRTLQKHLLRRPPDYSSNLRPPTI